MAKQLLLTLLVAAIVVFFARMKRARDVSRTEAGTASTSSQATSTTALVGYALAAVMIVTAGVLTWIGYQERNEILEVVVVDTRSGEQVVYSVRRKALGEREFRTIDGRLISLGSSDRMELIERD